MRFRKFIPLLGFHLLVGAASGATIVSSVTDLSFTYSGGASQVSSSAGTLVIETSKNSSATAALPAAYQLGTVGSTLGLTFDFAFDNAMSDATSSFNIAFGDSSTAGGYEFFVRLNPVTTGNGITFSESGEVESGQRLWHDHPHRVFHLGTGGSRNRAGRSGTRVFQPHIVRHPAQSGE